METLDNFKQVKLNIIEHIENIKLDDNNNFLAEDILTLYQNYLKLLDKLEEYKLPFLENLRRKEVVANQNVKGISDFFIEMILNESAPTASRLTQNLKHYKKLDINDICKIHHYLFKGLSKSDEFIGYRTNDNFCVLKNENGTSVIDYIPLHYKDINEGIGYILKLYNQEIITSEKDIFINPILIELLTSSYQCFHDGNTRLARILKTTQIWHLSNNSKIMIPTKIPSIYTSEAITILDKRKTLRKLVATFSTQPSNEILNQYIEVVLLTIERQIYLNQSKIEECYKTMKLLK